MVNLIKTHSYFPENWANDPKLYKKEVISKESLQYQSRNTLALAILQVTLQRNIRFGYVGIGGGFSKELAFTLFCSHIFHKISVQLIILGLKQLNLKM